MRDMWSDIVFHFVASHCILNKVIQDKSQCLISFFSVFDLHQSDVHILHQGDWRGLCRAEIIMNVALDSSSQSKDTEDAIIEM